MCSHSPGISERSPAQTRDNPGAESLQRGSTAPRALHRPPAHPAAPREPRRHVGDRSHLSFETADGRCSGVLRLTPDLNDTHTLKAWTLLTSLDEIKGHEEHVGRSRPSGEPRRVIFADPTGSICGRLPVNMPVAIPPVLVVGGGQAGLSAAARLTALQVDTLIVDRWPRVGDNWRKRYHALVLHNQVHVNHLPYMPFPPNWPTYIPKDKLAAWFEAYVEAMGLNYWTDTEFEGGTYDEKEGRWSVVVRRGDGTKRLMHPRHVIMATGVSGIPNIPDLPGLRNFAGTVLHSSHYEDGESWRGRARS